MNKNKDYAKALTNTVIIDSDIDDFILGLLNKKNIYIGRKIITKRSCWGNNKRNFDYQQINLDIKKELPGITTFSSIDFYSIQENGNAIIFYLTKNTNEENIIKNDNTILKLKLIDKKKLLKLLINFLFLDEEFNDIDNSIIADNIYFKISAAYSLKKEKEIQQNLLETNFNINYLEEKKKIEIQVNLITKKIKLNTISLKEAKSENMTVDKFLLDNPTFLKNQQGAESFFEINMEKARNSRLYIYQYINKTLSDILDKYNINYTNDLFESDNSYKIAIENIEKPEQELIIVNNTDDTFSNTDKFILKELFFNNENVSFFNNGYSSIDADVEVFFKNKKNKKFLFISDHNAYICEDDNIKTVNDKNFKLNTTYSEIQKKLKNNNDIKTDLYSKFKFNNTDKLSIMSQNIILLDDLNRQLSLKDLLDINISKPSLTLYPDLKDKYLSEFIDLNGKIKLQATDKQRIIDSILLHRDIQGLNILKLSPKISKTISELNIKDNLLSNKLISLKTDLTKIFLIKRFKDIYSCLIIDIIDNKLLINDFVQKNTLTELNEIINKFNSCEYDFSNISIINNDFTIIDNEYNIIQSTDTNKIIIGNPLNTYFDEILYSLSKNTNQPTNNINKGNEYNFLPYYINPMNTVESNIKEKRSYIYTQKIDKDTFNYISSIKESINNLSNANKIYIMKILCKQNNTDSLVNLFFNTFTNHIIKFKDFSKTTILEKYINIFIYN